MSRTMHNPAFAQRTWARFRALRPLDHMHPADRERMQRAAEGEKLRDELEALFRRPVNHQKPGQTSGPTKEKTMIKVNAGISRKVGESNYGSRGASVNVELELDSSSAADPQQLQLKIKQLFRMAKVAVDEELGLTNGQSATAGEQENGHVAHSPSTQPASNGSPRPTNGSTPVRAATEAQMRAIRTICGKLNIDPQHEVVAKFHCTLEELTLPNASAWIDELKKRAAQ